MSPVSTKGTQMIRQWEKHAEVRFQNNCMEQLQVYFPPVFANDMNPSKLFCLEVWVALPWHFLQWQLHLRLCSFPFMWLDLHCWCFRARNWQAKSIASVAFCHISLRSNWSKVLEMQSPRGHDLLWSQHAAALLHGCVTHKNVLGSENNFRLEVLVCGILSPAPPAPFIINR